MNPFLQKVSDLLDKALQAASGNSQGGTWADGARDVYTSMLGGLKGYGGSTLTKASTSFNEAIPYIERAGYEVTEIEVGIGLSPRIVPHLKVREIMDDDAKMALLEEVQDKRMVHTILNSLFKATSARRRLRFNDYHFTEIEMELSLFPTVVLRYKPDRDSYQRDRPDALIADAKSLGLVDDEMIEKRSTSVEKNPEKPTIDPAKDKK